MSEVYVSKSTNNPKKSISWLLENIGLPGKLRNICIKPNLNDYRRRETASTCDPYILDALLDILRSQYPNASVTILENDATGTNADNIFAFLGIDRVARNYRCHVRNVARGEWITKNVDGLHFTKIDVPTILTECDFFITFPKLKSHIKTKITCGLKNQMGLFRPKRKIEYHYILDELIVDCNIAMRPTLSLIDGHLAMEGINGPTYGSPRKLELLIASRDIVAADSFCAKLYGIRPRTIGHLKKASEKGLGKLNYRLKSDFDFDISQYKLKFNPFLFYIFNKLSKRIGS